MFLYEGVLSRDFVFIRPDENFNLLLKHPSKFFYSKGDIDVLLYVHSEMEYMQATDLSGFSVSLKSSLDTESRFRTITAKIESKAVLNENEVSYVLRAPSIQNRHQYIASRAGVILHKKYLHKG